MNIIDAYTAGIIDGEGSVTIQCRVTPCVEVTNTCLAMLERIQENYGGQIRKQKQYQTHHKDAWCWHVRGDKALAMLERILPMMLDESKVRRGQILLQEWKLKTPRNGRYSDEARTAKDEMVHRFFHGDAMVSTGHQDDD